MIKVLRSFVARVPGAGAVSFAEGEYESFDELSSVAPRALAHDDYVKKELVELGPKEKKIVAAERRKLKREAPAPAPEPQDEPEE